MELSYSIRNPNHVTKLTLLHGLGCTRNVWRNACSKLDKEFALLIPDQRGHGASCRPDSDEACYDPLNYGADLVDTFKSTQFIPSWIVGHSMGVRTACAAAYLRPELVRGLVLLDLPLAPSEKFQEFRQTFRRFFENIPLSFPSLKEARAFMAKDCPDLSLASSLLESLHPHQDGSVSLNFEKSAALQTIQRGTSAPLREWIRDLGNREMPILLLRGSHSLFWRKEDYEADQSMFRDFPSVTFKEIPGTGHALPFEKTERMVQEIHQFVANAPAKSDFQFFPKKEAYS